MLRDAFERCPRCESGLDVDDDCRHCGRCGGMLIDEATLVSMLQEARLTAPLPFVIGGFLPPESELILGEVGDRALRDAGKVTLACPRCRRPMTTRALHRELVDYCADHGVWIDGDDCLGRILARAGRF